MTIIRSVLAVVVGLISLSLVADGFEVAIVTGLNGSFPQDQAAYFGVRNRLAVLVAKLVYNTAAAFLAGYLVAWVAGRREVLHGAVLAIVQISLFVWGMAFSEYAGTTPLWAWASLTPLMGAGILAGARLRSARRGLVNR